MWGARRICMDPCRHLHHQKYVTPHFTVSCAHSSSTCTSWGSMVLGDAVSLLGVGGLANRLFGGPVSFSDSNLCQLANQCRQWVNRKPEIPFLKSVGGGVQNRGSLPSTSQSSPVHPGLPLKVQAKCRKKKGRKVQCGWVIQFWVRGAIGCTASIGSIVHQASDLVSMQPFPHKAGGITDIVDITEAVIRGCSAMQFQFSVCFWCLLRRHGFRPRVHKIHYNG
mmetsp:Transcript_42603/g.76529  ORF Transcript_42603/g.76529 Transcript_42603/m.76529 type:complete len:223 (+) Transcript_42603:874-1542(+)